MNAGTRIGAALLALLVGALLAGCGGGDSPEDVVADFYAATADGDAEKMCELVNEETATAAAEDEDVDTCEEGVEKSLASGDAEAAQGIADSIEVGEATIDGDTATVAVTAEGEEGDVAVVKEDDEWKVNLEG